MIRPGEPPRFLYLTASHPLLELVTKWILDYDTIRGVWGTLPIFLFRGFVRRIVNSATEIETGQALARRTSIDVEKSNFKKSLLSQVMRRLVARGDLKALAPLVHRDGTVNTIANLIGEIQRAAKRPEEFRAIIETRAADLNLDASVNTAGAAELPHCVPRQLDFDREIGSIYEAYARALDQFQLTEDDADQLRALQVISGEIDSKQVAIPWLDEVELLILDGFFDFTPVQGEILKKLIPRVPNVIVNLYGDEENEEVFRPFSDTLEQLQSMSDDFDVIRQSDSRDVGQVAAAIRTRLFNPEVVPEEGEVWVGEEVQDGSTVPIVGEGTVDGARPGGRDASGASGARPSGRDARGPSGGPRLFRCSDRETEVRAIAKEIKRLVLLKNVSIREIALVVRQRASYAETIARVFAEEQIPCNVERAISLAEIPAVRAVLKLFQILADERDAKDPRVTDLADLIKSGYFRLSDGTVRELRNDASVTQEQRLQFAADAGDKSGVGFWNPDELENVFAYVGSDLRLDKWLARAGQLASKDANAMAVRSQIFGDEAAESDDDEEEEKEDADDTEESKNEGQGARPSKEIPPAVLDWSALLLREFAARIKNMPHQDDGSSLRAALLKLLDDLQFASGIRKSLADLDLETALPHAALDLRALNGIRQAISAAIQSMEIAAAVTEGNVENTAVTLIDFISEIERCIDALVLSITSADRDGLQVLEATDVRGLQFRAIFIAGLIEGGFPLRKPRDWIYPHEERERLREYGLTLEDISPATLLKEEHYFYQSACRAAEHLYLTWPLILEGREETVVSYYIDELRHALAPLEIKSEDVRRDIEGDDVFDSSSRSELGSSLVRLSERHNHRSRKTVAVAKGEVDRLLNWAKENGFVTSSALARIDISRERMGRSYGRYDGLITNDDLRAMLADRYGADYVWSASALSLYGKSPYKFFAERVLKLEPRVEAALDLAAMDAGGLLHEALRRFFTGHRRERLIRTNRVELLAEMRSIADRVFREHERAVPPLNVHVWKIDCEIHQLQLARVIEYEIDTQNEEGADGPLPNFFELGFGMEHGIRDERSTPEFLLMSRDEENPMTKVGIRLRGQIDRVDMAADGTVIAYDYKLSRGAKEKDMIEGRDLQMGIYLDAIESLFFPGHEIAGGGYYLLRSCDRNRGLYRKAYDNYTDLSKSVTSRYEDDEWLEHRATMRRRIWQFVDRIRAGRFVVDPTAPDQTCGICDFAAVCRYEKYRILRKEFEVR